MDGIKCERGFEPMKQDMSYENLPTINRNVLIVVPTEGFLAWAKKNPTIFEIELDGWCADPSLWPKDRSMKMFKKFFRVHYCSSVIDMGDGPIDREYI
jgi:hypothetical protein